MSGISIVSWPSELTRTISYLCMRALVISVYKKYGVVLFEGAVQLTLLPEIRIKPFK